MVLSLYCQHSNLISATRLDPADATASPVARSLGLASPLSESAGAELAAQARVVMARVRRAFETWVIG